AIGNLGWRYFNIAGTSTGPVQAADGAWPNLGVMQWTTGTTAGNGFDLTLNGNGGGSGQLGALGGNAGWGFIWIFRLGSASAVRLYIGSGNVASGIVTFDPLNAWGLRYDTHAGIADTNFQFYARGPSGADVTLDTGVAGDTTWHTLLVYSAVAGTIRFSLDGGAEKAFCAAGCDNAAMTIPAAQMDPFVMLET